jgi:hypothetical protein
MRRHDEHVGQFGGSLGSGGRRKGQGGPPCAAYNSASTSPTEWHKAQDLPTARWVLASQWKCEHLKVQTAKRQHAQPWMSSGRRQTRHRRGRGRNLLFESRRTPGQRWSRRDRCASGHRRSLRENSGSVRFRSSFRQRCREGFSDGATAVGIGRP